MLLMNSFSLNMVPAFPVDVSFVEISLEEVRQLLVSELESAVGHADTAAIFADMLELPVPAVRATVQLHPGDTAIIGQYRGPRLPEGAHTLPEGATIQWVKLLVK